MIPLNKKILSDYIDACALVKETEQDIERLKKKRKTVVQGSVKGSNSEFPYQEQHFSVTGIAFNYMDDTELRKEEELLQGRKVDAEKVRGEVEAYLNTISARMQRIIRYKFFQGLSWGQVADKMGKKVTENSVKKEFQRFMKNN
ncbi:MAG: RNA polymerase subunit sigma-70 [Clostridium sp.]